MKAAQRSVSLLLTLMMFLTMLPIHAVAEETIVAEQTTATEKTEIVAVPTVTATPVPEELIFVPTPEVTPKPTKRPKKQNADSVATPTAEPVKHPLGSVLDAVQKSLYMVTEEENRLMTINVADIVMGKSFKISWDAVQYADHYEVSVVRIDVNGNETPVTSGANNRVNTGSKKYYTVSSAYVTADTQSFRIYVGAAADAYPCDWTRMIKSNTVTINMRYSADQEMDVSLYVAGGSAEVVWDEVDGADYYLYSVLDLNDGEYIFERVKTTNTEFSIRRKYVVDLHKYKIWVAAYSNDSDAVIAQHLVQTVLISECLHELTLKTNEHGVYKEEEIDDVSHELYNIYDLVCKTCGEILAEDMEESLGREEHDYSSKGVCTICHYAGGECLHESTSPEYTRTEYKAEDEKTHTKVEHFDLVCDYCEAVIPLRNTELYETARTKRTEGLKHNFYRGTCEDCGYIKAAELTVTLKRGQASANVGESITASATIAGGSGTYQVIWNVYCNGECVKSDVTGAWIVALEHSASYKADRIGEWYFEAIVYDSDDQSTSGKTAVITVREAVCEHGYEEILQENLTTYEDVNDLQHRIVYTYANVCSMCGDVAGTWLRDAFEDHAFDAEGVCVCGAIKEKVEDCVHEWKSTVAEVKTEQTNRNDRLEKHSVTTVYDDTCGKCGSVSTHTTEEYVAHVFDSKGQCECGLIEVSDSCDHATDGVVEGDPVYVCVNDDVHSVTTYERHKCECGDVDELRESVVQAAHTYTNGVCVCGKEEPAQPCEHPSSEAVWDTECQFTYKSLSADEHARSGYMYDRCIVCKEIIKENYAVTKNYPHTFDSNDTCADCGYSKGCKHIETTDKYIETTYAPLDDVCHTATDIYSRVCADPDCGWVLVDRHESLNVVRQEEHRFDGDACIDCKYVRKPEGELSVVAIAGQSTAYVGDTVSATANVTGGTGEYKYGWVVSWDGEVINQTDMGMGKNYGIGANKPGTYVLKVIVIDSEGNKAEASCAPITVKIPHEWKDVTETTHTYVSANGHEKTTTTYQVCTKCGEQTEKVVVTETEQHKPSYRKFKTSHPHQLYGYCKLCNHEYLVNHYDTANGKRQEADVCCICHGHAWGAPQEVNGEWQKVCSKCGKTEKTETPICDHAEKRIEGEATYSPFNLEQHMEELPVTYMCECGKTRKETIEFGLMNHTWVDGVCSLCGTGGIAMKTIEVVSGQETQTADAEQIRKSISGWKDGYSLFDAASESVLNAANRWEHRFASSVYEAADIIGTTTNLVIDGILSRDEQDEIDELMAALVMENYLATISQQSTPIDDTVEDILENADRIVGVAIPEVSNEGVKVFQVSDKIPGGSATANGITIVYNGVEILCDTAESAWKAYVMQKDYEKSMEYLEKLETTTSSSSALYRACQIVKEEINEKWPVGLSARQSGNALSSAAKAFTTWTVSYQSGNVLKVAAKTIKDAQRNASYVSDAMKKAGIYLGDGTAATSTQAITSEIATRNMGAAPKIGDAAGVLMAWSTGNAIGKLLTWSTGETKKAEEKILQLYILNAEIEQCMRDELQDDGNAALDITSLYLTMQEVGLDTAVDYFVSYGRANAAMYGWAYQLLVDYPTEKEFKAWLSSQKEKINTLRVELGLIQVDESLTEEELIDKIYQNLVEEASKAR